jgi:hypothetical protein
MATMRKIDNAAAATMSAEITEWPTLWESAKKEGKRTLPGLIALDSERSPLTVGDVNGLEYHYRETDVGCAEHQDPTCLCDVVIDQPLQMSATYDYEYANVADKDAGTLNWWMHVLGMHDAHANITKLATDTNGKVTKWATQATGSCNLLQFALDLDDPAMSSADLSDIYGISQYQIRHLRRKLNGQERRR